ncbi:Ser/Thr protein kinase RdoA (MazF antagonist) [Deinococcus metalli]|uniref:Ser/Thr protein kinase RdoA (MazF antagonist) n=1 Tax=Deinococcus metalli TaxID=1141878 RepID=A0A7W8KAP6_9DEIO|nr:aminoglycoside phosphotransferase family protein [Deinococcus metalli]MBB5374787.1 Ser/Thr protein kinase RdoA (MazF antagonist) [Deinococcus metalli]GHF33726.1 hypothetical protein GCM10017781_08110 [Deinococcus metalli]
MSAPPDLDSAALVSVVSSAFGLDVDSVTFLPTGTAHAYRAQGPAGRFFLKVMPDSPYGARVTARALAEVPLLRALRASGVLPRVPMPLPTLDGGWMAALGGLHVFAYAWIEGAAVGDGWDAARPDLAGLLGRLHGATDELMRAVPVLPMPPEDFGLPFEGGLRAAIDALPHLPPDARPEQRALRDVLAPHLDTVARVLERTVTLAAALRQRTAPQVVCHTDAHGGNVMRDAAGLLWLIDWETARLAPPEHDLWMLGPHLPTLLPAYEYGLGRPYTPDADRLRYYVLRRPLEDLEEDVRWLLHDHPAPQVAAHSLEIIARYVLPALHRAEADAEATASRDHEA